YDRCRRSDETYHLHRHCDQRHRLDSGAAVQRDQSDVSKAAKVDQSMIHRIKELRNQQKTQAEIAAEVGVAQGTVSLILRTLDLGGPLVTQRKTAGWRPNWCFWFCSGRSPLCTTSPPIRLRRPRSLSRSGTA